MSEERRPVPKPPTRKLEARPPINQTSKDAHVIASSTTGKGTTRTKKPDLKDIPARIQKAADQLQSVTKELLKDQERFEAADKAAEAKNEPAAPLPPINLESPDGERVVEVTDPDKAKSMVSKGWKITDRKKTPYKAPERLTTRPFSENADLEALRKSLTPAKKNIKENKR